MPASNIDVLTSFQNAVMRQATSSGMREAAHTTGVTSFVSKRAVMFLTQMLLAFYFYRRGDRTVLRLDCELLRPLAWLLARREQEPCETVSGSGTYECPAGEICSISYYLFGMVFGVIVRRVIAAVKTRK